MSSPCSSDYALDVFRSVPKAMALFDREGQCLLATDVFRALSPGLACGESGWRQYLAWLSTGTMKRAVRSALQACEPVTGYTAMPDGRILCFTHESAGDRAQLICTVEDVTDSFREIRIAHVLRDLLDNTSDAIGMADSERFGFYINKTLEGFLGVEVDQLDTLKLKVDDVQPQGIGEHAVVDALALAKENDHFSSEAMLHNVVTGEEHLVSQVITAHVDIISDEIIYSAIMRDISELDRYRQELVITNQQLEQMLGQSETELRQRRKEAEYSHQLWRSVVDHQLNLVLIADGSGEILFSNTIAEGVGGRELCGRNILNLIEKKWRSTFEQSLAALMAGEQEHFTQEAGFDLGKDVQFVGLASVSSFVRGDGARVVTMLVADITENSRDRKRLLESQKLAATGRMAAKLAHEINNPLAGIKSAITIVSDELPPGSVGERYAGLISRELDRVGRIIKQLYGLYRPHQEDSSRVFLREVLDDCLILLGSRFRARSVSIAMVGGAKTHAKIADNSFRQVILNILSNALEACASGGVIRIRILTHGKWGVVAVRDSGHGLGDLPEESIFEPFFSTKKSNDGAGLGLGMAVSRGLVRSMGGDIRIRNRRIGSGALCVVFVPIA